MHVTVNNKLPTSFDCYTAVIVRVEYDKMHEFKNNNTLCPLINQEPLYENDKLCNSRTNYNVTLWNYQSLILLPVIPIDGRGYIDMLSLSIFATSIIIIHPCIYIYLSLIQAGPIHVHALHDTNTQSIVVFVL